MYLENRKMLIRNIPPKCSLLTYFVLLMISSPNKYGMIIIIIIIIICYVQVREGLLLWLNVEKA